MLWLLKIQCLTFIKSLYERKKMLKKKSGYLLEDTSSSSFKNSDLEEQSNQNVLNKDNQKKVVNRSHSRL
jgi:hypothetical protein